MGVWGGGWGGFHNENIVGSFTIEMTPQCRKTLFVRPSGTDVVVVVAGVTASYQTFKTLVNKIEYTFYNDNGHSIINKRHLSNSGMLTLHHATQMIFMVLLAAFPLLPPEVARNLQHSATQYDLATFPWQRPSLYSVMHCKLLQLWIIYASNHLSGPEVSLLAGREIAKHVTTRCMDVRSKNVQSVFGRAWP